MLDNIRMNNFIVNAETHFKIDLLLKIDENYFISHFLSRKIFFI